MATVAKALGKGALFEFENLSLTMSPWTYDVQAEYEKYLIARAYANLRVSAAELGPEYQEERAALRRDIDAGEYDFGEMLVKRSLRVDKNLKHLIYLCLAYGQRNEKVNPVTKVLVERICKDRKKFQEAVELLWEVNRDDIVPNSTPEGEPPEAASEPATA